MREDQDGRDGRDGRDVTQAASDDRIRGTVGEMVIDGEPEAAAEVPVGTTDADAPHIALFAMTDAVADGLRAGGMARMPGDAIGLPGWRLVLVGGGVASAVRKRLAAATRLLDIEFGMNIPAKAQIACACRDGVYHLALPGETPGSLTLVVGFDGAWLERLTGVGVFHLAMSQAEPEPATDDAAAVAKSGGMPVTRVVPNDDPQAQAVRREAGRAGRRIVLMFARSEETARDYYMDLIRREQAAAR